METKYSRDINAPAWNKVAMTSERISPPNAVALIQQWRDPKSELRVRVRHWLIQQPIRDQYLEYPKAGWLVWQYVRRFGVRAVIGKIRSRLAERSRNSKCAGVGVGEVIEAPDEQSGLIGRSVVFFAASHGAKQQLVVVPACCIAAIPTEAVVAEARCRDLGSLDELLQRWQAWSPHSGRPLAATDIGSALTYAAESLDVTVYDHSTPRHEPMFTSARAQRADVPPIRPTAVLFGLGNYAKTAILPNIKSDLRLERIHELDPDQLRFLGKHPPVDIDTCPMPRGDRTFDVWLIAGYHHTHADLARMALNEGAAAVVEKPLVTTRTQYLQLLDAISNSPNPRLFACFHKRYSTLNAFVHADLGCVLGSPIDMHCVVYEIPLPAHHWYNWPNSGSRLISNGCHWIDYFMFVNDYVPLVGARKWTPRGKDVVVQIQLENGAYFSMSLTDTGSQRLGVRDHIELRHGGTTVTLTDGTYYASETRQRVIRRVRRNPLDAYARMYRTIARAISLGQCGDDLKSLRSTEAMLQLEELSVG